MESEKTLKREEILATIAKSSIYGNLGLFVGAGMSKAILNDDFEYIALSWGELIEKCAKSFDIALVDLDIEGLSYPDISSSLAKAIAQKENIGYHEALLKLKEKIAELTCWYPNKDQRAEYGPFLEKLSPSWIITTNYDTVLESLLTGKCISLTPSEQLISPKDLIPIYHLHGIRSNPDSIIISQEDYISLFRPNQYRQQKLSLSLKESTTLMIGYGLGDINVLTAVDWTNNVYSSQKITYPHGLIQLLYTDTPKAEPYKDHNGIIILEFKDLKDVLFELNKVIDEANTHEKEINSEFESVNNYFMNPDMDEVIKLITDEKLRLEIIKLMDEGGTKLISGFMELFSKLMDETWQRTAPSGAFYAYAENLSILLDIIIHVNLNKLSPALFESIVYNLNRVAFYVGPYKGDSNQAYRDWIKRKDSIPEDTLAEIKRLARIKRYYNISELLKK